MDREPIRKLLKRENFALSFIQYCDSTMYENDFSIMASCAHFTISLAFFSPHMFLKRNCVQFCSGADGRECFKLSKR